MSGAPEVRLIAGDCREVMAQLAADGVQVDSLAADPPNHLTSIVKSFGGPGAAAAKVGKAAGATGAYARASKGFMGQTWDGDDNNEWGGVAFDPATWRLAYDLLKPGGHLVAFSGTRTYHRMATAIELAGFEIRDMLAWVYGSGFPKNHDLSKQIDKRRDWSGLTALQGKVKLARQALRLSQSAAARRCGFIGPGESLVGGGFMWFETGRRIPSREDYLKLKAGLALDDACDLAFEAAEREVVGTNRQAMNWTPDGMEHGERDITAPETDAAKVWAGWGTALKPALEPICLARKPLGEGSVAANVLAHGTGAVNLDGCAVPFSSASDRAATVAKNAHGAFQSAPRENAIYGADDREQVDYTAASRHPANLLHDGSQEVVEAFQPFVGFGAANPTRFFYCAKADKADRCGSKHPTVKPVALMRWLVRLVTPPGGVVLDPFAGSGTTGEAAILEGFGGILIEREAQYQADIERRLARARQVGGGLLAGL